MTTLYFTDPEAALDYAQELLGLLDDLPRAAEDFADDVREKVTGVHDWILERGYVTVAQASALENWRAGAVKWLSR